MRHRLLLACLLLIGGTAAHAEEAVRVFAAASLTNALQEIAATWQQAGHPSPSLAFAGSSTLAKQIEAGAPADVYAAADLAWMDYLQARDKLVPGTRASLLGNSLVLIAPRGRGFAVRMEKGEDLAGHFQGKLCTGEPDVVPVGIYARQSLEALGWWQPLQGRIVGTDDVRTALAFVERGECPLGIVYATDAAGSNKVEMLATFPERTHQPIVYPFALVAGARPEAHAFLAQLQGPQAAAVFRRHGFVRLQP